MTCHLAILAVLDIRHGRRWPRAAAWLWLQGQADPTGRIVTTLADLSEAFGWPRTTVRRFLTDLEAANAATVQHNGHPERIISLCEFSANSLTMKKTGHAQEADEPSRSVIRAPSAPDKRAAFFADMVCGPDPVQPGAISAIMAQALVKGGLVSADKLRKKGITL